MNEAVLLIVAHLEDSLEKTCFFSAELATRESMITETDLVEIAYG